MKTQVPAKQVAYYAREINQHWQKAVVNIFRVCALLVDAKDQLKTIDWEDLKDDLPFSDSVLKKLLIIGNDKRLQKQKVQKLLPPSYSTIYEITQLQDDELTQAVDDKEISPRMSRSEFIGWRKERRGQTQKSSNLQKPTQPKLGPDLFAGISLAEEFGPDELLRLEQDLAALADRYGLTIIYGKAEKELRQIARDKLAEELLSGLTADLSSYAKNLQPDERDVIESAHAQFIALQVGNPMLYPADHPDSIEHPKHKFSLKSGWDQAKFHQHLYDKHILTSRSPIKKHTKLGKTKCVQFAYQYLTAKTSTQKANHKKSLEDIARRRDTNAKHAKRCLKMIEGL